MFFYDPKFKKTLPYYDTFPLVLPLETYNDGFLGINMHYLPIPLRVNLLDQNLGNTSLQLIQINIYMFEILESSKKITSFSV